MQFTPSNREDINKYYRGSFLKFKETGDLLFYLQGVDSNVVTGTIEDGRDFKIYLAEEEPYEVDYILPHKSFFQYGENACMLQRVPAKQYHRGITNENTRISYRDPGTAIPAKVAIGFDPLKAFVKKQKFFTLSEATKQDLTSAVLAPRIMYMRTNKQIFIDFTPVARVAMSEKKITMLLPVFTEEIKDFLKTTQEDKMFTIQGEKA